MLDKYSKRHNWKTVKKRYLEQLKTALDPITHGDIKKELEIIRKQNR
jgi:hypothetical protein